MIPKNDLDYLLNQLVERISIILSQMTELMDETYRKVEKYGTEGWFLRMCRSVAGQTFVTEADFAARHEDLCAYMSEAVQELYKRERIEQRVLPALSIRLNELSVKKEKRSKTFAELVKSVNSAVDGFDRFQNLLDEIGQRSTMEQPPLVLMLCLIAQMDSKTLQNSDRLATLRTILRQYNVIGEQEISGKGIVESLLSIPVSDAGMVGLGMQSAGGNVLVGLAHDALNHYQYLPDMKRRLTRRDSVVARLLEAGQFDGDATVSTEALYDDLLAAKKETAAFSLSKTEEWVDEEKAAQPAEPAPKTREWYRQAAEKGDAEAMLWVADRTMDQTEAEKWYLKAVEQGNDDALIKLGALYLKQAERKHGTKECEKIYLKSIDYYEKAFDLGIETAKESLRTAYQELANYYYDKEYSSKKHEILRAKANKL